MTLIKRSGTLFFFNSVRIFHFFVLKIHIYCIYIYPCWGDDNFVMEGCYVGTFFDFLNWNGGKRKSSLRMFYTIKNDLFYIFFCVKAWFALDKTAMPAWALNQNASMGKFSIFVYFARFFLCVFFPASFPFLLGNILGWKNSAFLDFLVVGSKNRSKCRIYHYFDLKIFQKLSFLKTSKMSKGTKVQNQESKTTHFGVIYTVTHFLFFSRIFSPKLPGILIFGWSVFIFLLRIGRGCYFWDMVLFLCVIFWRA